jgi:hypothetical protein
MTADSGSGRRAPRGRFADTEYVFDLRGIATGLRDEITPVRDGHRQITILHKPPLRSWSSPSRRAAGWQTIRLMHT